MACIINASTSNGLVNTADGSGVIKLQSNGVTTNALAWVNFNGTGTVAISTSYNVSSITDNGTGDYTVNFATALTDADYAISAFGIINNTTDPCLVVSAVNNTTRTTSAFRLSTVQTNTAARQDAFRVSVVFHGN